MALTTKTDKRFKLSQHKVDKIRELRKQGKTLQFIANKYDVSTATIQYWTNTEYRLKQKEKIRHYKSDNKRRVELKKETYKNFTRENTLGYIQRCVENVKYKPKNKQYKLFGLDYEYWENIIKKENIGKNKIK